MRFLTSSILASAVITLGSSSAMAANPFASAGEFGVGDGWRTFPGKAAGDTVTRDGDKLRLDATGEDMLSACTAELLPVDGRILLTGLWKADGLTAAQDWQGARVQVIYFDEGGKRLKGDENTPMVAFSNDKQEWASLDTALIAPPEAAKARVCGELVGAKTGSMWLKDVNLTNLIPSELDETGKNVLWILVDTLRADVLGAYGNETPVSPRMDQLAAESVFYENSWTQYTWTVPSTISFFTSQFARTHGWNSTFEKVAAGDYTEMSDKVPTLAQVLREEGWITTGNYANGLLKSGIGVSRGFLEWKHGNDEEVVKRSIADIEQWGSDGGQNFLYVHLMTPHIPIWPTGKAQEIVGETFDTPEEGFRYYEGPLAEKMSQDEFNDLFAKVYEASVFDADRYVGQVLDALEKHGHADDTIVILTSDHGELIGEHGLLGHGSYVYEGLTHVPLFVKAPGESPRRVKDRVGETVDVAPTVLDWLDMESKQPRGWQGLSLFEEDPGSVAASERDYMATYTSDGRWKIIENRDSGELLQAFDLQADPGEVNSLSSDPPAEIQSLQKEAAAWRKATPLPDAEELKSRKTVEKSEEKQEEELEMLRALGYIE